MRVPGYSFIYGQSSSLVKTDCVLNSEWQKPEDDLRLRIIQDIFQGPTDLLCHCSMGAGIWTVLEQPKGSLLFDEPGVAHALGAIRARSVTVHLGCFHAPTLKPLTLQGTAPWLEQLQDISKKRKASGVADGLDRLCTYDEDGNPTGTGAVPESEAYPEEFCEPRVVFNSLRLIGSLQVS